MSLRPLLTGLIDYAGLFPPAALPMREVVANYAAYRASPHAWMLGRLVVPVSQIAACHSERSAQREGEESAPPWRISALMTDIDADAHSIRAWNVEHAHDLLVDSCEAKASSVADVERIAAVRTSGITTFVEIPVSDDPAPLLDAIKAADLNAKIRTGGITEDAFPPADHIERFLVACADRAVAFKATAGLHHPVRGRYRLTYADDAPQGAMYGFLNLFMAAALAHAGLSDQVLEALLDAHPLALVTALPADVLARTRASFALSFGSCSVTEPVEALEQLGIL